MNWKYYLGITIIALVVVILLAGFQTAPGYMDAEYYYAMGLRIANKEGLTEPFVWNYLTTVDSVPHPGFTYWMPVPAFISALGIWISGLDTFTGAKLVHLLLAALVPALTMRIAWEISGKASVSVLAGSLAVFPAFYNVFLGTTDSFGITMLLGGAFFLLAKKDWGIWKFIGLGGIAGLMHLTRADGLIWLVAGSYCAMRDKERKHAMALGVIMGYLLVMAPWFIRNMAVFGSAMPPGTSRTFWFQEYNDLFSFYPEGLTFQNWISQGGTAILKNYQKAGIANLKSILLVQGQVILTPVMAIGAWKNRKDHAAQGVFLAWICILLLMSFIFPFAGLRGGFTHSGAGFQPMFWALAGSGFNVVIFWGIEKREWIEKKAGFVFGTALVLLVAISSLFIFHDRVIGESFENPVWNSSFLEAKGVSEYLMELGAEDDDLIMINNPPGFYASSGRSSIVIPNGDINVLLAAAEAFGAEYLVLEKNHPQDLSELYSAPDLEDKLEYLGSSQQAKFFRIPAE